MDELQVQEPYKLFINGNWRTASTDQTFATYNPATETEIAQIARGDVADIEQAVVAARQAFEGRWGRLRPKDRSRLLYAAHQAILDNVEPLAQLETLNNGKPLPQARQEVISAARYFEYYAGAADKIHGEQIPLGPDFIDFTVREPMGVTAHILPWNKPLNILVRSLAPALAAGNTAVIKPSEHTSLSALKLVELLAECDFPPGVINVVTGYGEEAGAALAGHTDIDHLTFTGSATTGRVVMKAAAEHIKPVVLELGGKSPLIIFADADLDTVVQAAVKGIITNCGQMCTAGSRILVETAVKEPFLEKLVGTVQHLAIGPGLDSPDLGPLVSATQYGRVTGHIDIASSEGAHIRYGGQRPSHLPHGYFIEPTVFDDVLPDMFIAQQEVFGPVLAVLTFQDETNALHIANQIPYGLVAGIFTNDINRALRLATHIRAGQVFINDFYTGDEEMPFGGYGQSGFGREKGLAALEHYTQIKNIAIRIHP